MLINRRRQWYSLRHYSNDSLTLYNTAVITGVSETIFLVVRWCIEGCVIRPLSREGTFRFCFSSSSLPDERLVLVAML
jgi:hypothetical protein